MFNRTPYTTHLLFDKQSWQKYSDAFLGTYVSHNNYEMKEGLIN